MEIVTLEQAGKHLMEEGVVNYENMTVEGKQLLEVCGYSTGDGNTKKVIERQITKHDLKEGKDFTTDIVVRGRHRVKMFYFSMNSANHILLAAMTEKGKAARQEAIDTKVAIDSDLELRSMLMQVMQSQQDTLARLEAGYTSLIEDKEKLIIKKSTPSSLSKLIGNGSSKVVQAANLWLESEGYQTMRFVNGKRNGWTLTDKGRKLGTQVHDASIQWVPEIKTELPTTHELLDFAERLGLKDMKKL